MVTIVRISPNAWGVYGEARDTIYRIKYFQTRIGTIRYDIDTEQYYFKTALFIDSICQETLQAVASKIQQLNGTL